MEQLKYRRIVLKLSGEALGGPGGFGIDPDVLSRIAASIKEAAALKVEIAIVVGGGNFWRGAAGSAKEWTAALQIIWGCWRLVSMPWRCRMPWRKPAYPRGYRQRLRCGKSLSLTSGAELFATWRRKEL